MLKFKKQQLKENFFNIAFNIEKIIYCLYNVNKFELYFWNECRINTSVLEVIMNKQEILDKIKNGLIVSCQALEDEPLHSSYIMSRMAFAAMEGGACGIRANSVEDICEIKKTVSLPVIGIIKTVFDDSDVYITSTAEDVEKLIECKADVIAIDATDRLRHGKKTLD